VQSLAVVPAPGATLFPSTQGVHAVAPTPEYFPTGHEVVLDAFVFTATPAEFDANLPAPACKQGPPADPGAQYPEVHSVQTATFPSENLPATQAVCLTAPEAAELPKLSEA